MAATSKAGASGPAAPKIRALIPVIPINEQRGRAFAEQLISYIDKHRGRYLRDESGKYHVILGRRRIPLIEMPDNQPLAQLMLDACDVSTVSPAARAAIQRLQAEAGRRAGKMQLRRFSARSPDGARLYVPLEDGQLLQITGDELKCVPNGDNEDHFWVEHPYGAVLKYSAPDAKAGLDRFERLLVDTQACKVPSMRWFVAMNAGFFPYVRDSCAARFLLELIGPTQQGKTTGAQRFATLHGLGQVKGDFSVAALGSLGDIGLLVLDNKEQANFGQPLIDFCLFLATGGERGRAEVDGRLRTATSGRPVGMITTIEGVAKAELQSRCVEVNYGVTGAKSPREPIEQEISECRHEIGSAIMLVLQRYLKVRNEHRPTPNPIPDFEEHFGVLCDLLRAYGEIAGNPPDWAEGIIKDWNAALSAAEPDEDDLEHPILRVLDDVDTGPPKLAFTHNDAKGTLYVTEAFELLTAFQKLNLRDLSLPKTAQGLSRRLRSCRFRSLTFLPTDTEGVAALKRTAHRKPIGFFRPDEE